MTESDEDFRTRYGICTDCAGLRNTHMHNCPQHPDYCHECGENGIHRTTCSHCPPRQVVITDW